MQHGTEHAALQEHSVGDEYPWAIKRVGDSFWQPHHCITGEVGPQFLLKWEEPYKQAEKWIVERKRADSQSKVEPPIVLSEYTFLIPLTPQNGGAHSAGSWQGLNTILLDRFGGYTIGNNVEGAWASPTGYTILDTSAVYKVALDPNDSEVLTAVLEECKTRFDQKCIYCALTSSHVTLV